MLQSIFTKISQPIACYLDFDYLLVILFHAKIYGTPIYLNIWASHIVQSNITSYYFINFYYIKLISYKLYDMIKTLKKFFC